MSAASQGGRRVRGWCHGCDRLMDDCKVIAEIDQASGGGSDVLRCPDCLAGIRPRRSAAQAPRRYPQ